MRGRSSFAEMIFFLPAEQRAFSSLSLWERVGVRGAGKPLAPFLSRKYPPISPLWKSYFNRRLS
jgi:hypothetical protein